MKKIILAAVAVICILSACGERGITGMWKCELFGSEQIIEFTADGRFIDHTSGSENRYKIQGGNIVTYVEDAPESEIKLPYKISDGVLKIGEAEYEKVEPETESYEQN